MAFMVSLLWASLLLSFGMPTGTQSDSCSHICANLNQRETRATGSIVLSPSLVSFFFFLRFYVFIFREKGKEAEREGEKHQCERETMMGCLFYVLQLGSSKPTTQARALTRNRTCDLSLCGMMLNQLSCQSPWKLLRCIQHGFAEGL